MEDVTFDGAEGERRGPVVVAGVLTVGLPFIMPEFFRNDTGMGLLAVLVLLIIAMFVLDPRPDRPSSSRPAPGTTSPSPQPAVAPRCPRAQG